VYRDCNGDCEGAKRRFGDLYRDCKGECEGAKGHLVNCIEGVRVSVRSEEAFGELYIGTVWVSVGAGRGVW
jgi:hypothetical protein